MAKIVSANLGKDCQKIYDKINKIRPYGWFSKDVQTMLQEKYGLEKHVLVQQLQDKQEQRNKIEIEIKELAKKINRMKDE